MKTAGYVFLALGLAIISLVGVVGSSPAALYLLFYLHSMVNAAVILALVGVVLAFPPQPGKRAKTIGIAFILVAAVVLRSWLVSGLHVSMARDTPPRIADLLMNEAFLIAVALLALVPFLREKFLRAPQLSSHGTVLWAGYLLFSLHSIPASLGHLRMLPNLVHREFSFHTPDLLFAVALAALLPIASITTYIRHGWSLPFLGALSALPVLITAIAISCLNPLLFALLSDEIVLSLTAIGFSVGAGLALRKVDKGRWV